MANNPIEKLFSADRPGYDVICHESHNHYFTRGETIFINLRDSSETAIVIKGTVLIVNISSDGQKSILDICRSGDAFGCGLFPYKGFDACCAVTKTDSEISFINYEKLLLGCEATCSGHSRLIDNILGGAARRYVMHIEILSRRTIREKLLNAFCFLLDPHVHKEQKLPISLSELADFLCCDRSAMMRELKHLNEDRIIASRGSRITLIMDITQF